MSETISSDTGTAPAGSIATNASVNLNVLPPQYSTGGDLGFPTRQLETVPTAVTVGPDGALYVAELTGIPYPTGYARIVRVDGGEGGVSFDGETPAGLVQVHASGFTQINGLSFDGAGNLFVLEYVNASAIYAPTGQASQLPPGRLIFVGADGVRQLVSGPELELANYVLADKSTGDVYVSVGSNTDIGEGKVLRYRHDAESGAWTHEVVASGLNNPRGLSFGPDGNLYVMEQGRGTDSDSPDAATAPTTVFIPGAISQRFGYTGSITRIEMDEDGGQERIFTGLPSSREFNAATGEDRVLSTGANGFTIAPDGTVWVATGGGLSNASVAELGEIGQDLLGLVRIDGLFDGDPSDATYTTTFDAVAYAGAFGPDGATTLFNAQSNLNDVVIGQDGNIYAVDAARNVMYGLDSSGRVVESVTVFQKMPPVLTPPQFAATIEIGGDPALDYQVEIAQRTAIGRNNLPDTPGRANLVMPDPSTPPGPPPGTSAGGDAPPNATGADGDAATGGPPVGAPPPATSPIPASPTSPPILPDNPYATYFDPYFGVYTPPTAPLVPIADGRSYYTVSTVYSFGDRVMDDGGTYGAAAVAQAAGLPPPNAGSIYYQGGFSDGPNWTTHLANMLGVRPTGEDTNFAYVNATARPIENPLDPYQSFTNLTSFAGQIDAFEQTGRTFRATDLVAVSFGGNDLTLPTGLPPEEAIAASVEAILDGLERLAGLGARHFLVANVANVELAPLFNDPNFLAALGASPGTFTPLVDQFNIQLTTALDSFEASTGLNVEVLDTNRLFDAIAANPSLYGFTNVDQPVLAIPPLEPGTPQVYNPAIVGQDPIVQHGTLFLDPFFHPTALGHAILAETARDTLLL